MFLVAGLGNPGTAYILTRHNAGFMAVDGIASSHGFQAWHTKKKSVLALGQMSPGQVLLLKPQTFMNASGESLQEVMAFYKIPLNNVWVIHDDIDLPVGEIRIKQGGGNAGHNGLKSIDTHIGNAYHRIRIGIGRPEHKEEVVSWVLSKFSEEELKKMQQAFQEVIERLPDLLEGTK